MVITRADSARFLTKRWDGESVHYDCAAGDLHDLSPEYDLVLESVPAADVVSIEDLKNRLSDNSKSNEVAIRSLDVLDEIIEELSNLQLITIAE